MRLRWVVIGLAAFVLVLGVLGFVLRWRAMRRMGPTPAPIVVKVPEVPEDNGYDIFLGAARMYVERADPFVEAGVPVTPEQRETLRENAGALAELRRGLDKPCAIPPLASPATEMYPATTELRHLGYLLVLESRVAREQNQPKRALAWLVDALRYGGKLETRGTSGHRGSAGLIQSMALVELQSLVTSREWTDDELTGLLHSLAGIRSAAAPIAQWIEVCHEMSLRALDQFAADPRLLAEASGHSRLQGAAARMNVQEVRGMLTEHRNRALEASQRPFPVVKNIDLKPRAPVLPSVEFGAFEVLASIWEGFLRNDFIRRCRWRGTELVVAIELYRGRHGQPPASLQELGALAVPGVRLALTDPLTEKPFVYRAANGDYWLYSVGWDLDDDGGAQMDGQRREGDIVFHSPSRGEEGQARRKHPRQEGG